MAKPRRRKLRQRRDDPVLDRVLEEVLNGNVDVIPEFADLPRRWREAPADASDRENPWDPTKDELLARYIWLAFTQKWAREGLRGLNQELTRNREPIPGLLRWWNHCLRVLGNPPTRRGPEYKVDRDARVSIAYKFLGSLGWTKEDALARIAETMECSDQTVKSVIDKKRISLRYR